MSIVVYVAAAGLAVAALLLLPGPRVSRRNPLTVSTCISAALGAVCFTCSAPATLARVNEMTGVPNFGAPLTYSFISAYSASVLILLIHWRGGPQEQIRVMVTRIVIAYSILIVAVITLFQLGSTPVERLQDLDTYYARTPYIGEMIIFYLVGHAVCAVSMIVLSLRWSRTVTGLLRTGLRLIMIGLTLDAFGFVLAKVVAVAARWSGHDLDWLSTAVAPPAVSLGALITSAGFVLPRLLPTTRDQWQSMRDYRALAPLWEQVKGVSTVPKPSPSRWRLPKGRLQVLELAIHDALLQLAPAFNQDLGKRVYVRALDHGSSRSEALAVSEAAMVVDAAADASSTDSSTPPQGTAVEVDRYRLLATTASGTRELVQLAQALEQLPAVQEPKPRTRVRR
ncbi:hypothetical protein BIV25_21515 [Streptomyces sp. MUSC 14]|uniref:MAB_1171c family putative transporter n=1 Tax=Streptomyces sp. MUSC 14 TaxID=1354889 RepID=UPI0008F59A08|nr:MAB_1171c family putative transporter [Streptomyces sp. MUSC 14]OIJ94664.1 hypothetical protein BIV25_21515 [Streptomyces sp. MUSC 14]